MGILCLELDRPGDVIEYAKNVLPKEPGLLWSTFKLDRLKGTVKIAEKLLEERKIAEKLLEEKRPAPARRRPVPIFMSPSHAKRQKLGMGASTTGTRVIGAQIPFIGPKAPSAPDSRAPYAGSSSRSSAAGWAAAAPPPAPPSHRASVGGSNVLNMGGCLRPVTLTGRPVNDAPAAAVVGPSAFRVLCGMLVCASSNTCNICGPGVALLQGNLSAVQVRWLRRPRNFHSANSFVLPLPMPLCHCLALPPSLTSSPHTCMSSLCAICLPPQHICNINAPNHLYFTPAPNHVCGRPCTARGS